MNIQCLTNTSQTARIISLQWYDGKHGQIETDAPSLMVCYENGRVQIMKNETDESKSRSNIISASFSLIKFQIRSFWILVSSLLDVNGTMMGPF